MSYDFAVFIGRFQPLHLGHQYVIDEALSQADKVILLVGSSFQSRSVRNPFTFEERARMISQVYRQQVAQGRLIIKPLADMPYNDTAWIADVQAMVNEVILEEGNGKGVRLHGLKDFNIALAGHNKDASSYYVKMFPEWGAITISSQHSAFHATTIREDFFRGSPILPRDTCHEEVVEYLAEFRFKDAFQDLVAEADYVRAYKKSWEAAPYPPTFVTADAVVVQSGHVLLIRRGDNPGKGLLAIPGGFVDQTETLKEAATRELREETKIADQKGTLPPAMLNSFIDLSATRVFDAPHRSVRGRVITHAFLFRCPERKALFQVTGADDAIDAAWYRLGDLNPEDFFEDHWAILHEMIGL